MCMIYIIGPDRLPPLLNFQRMLSDPFSCDCYVVFIDDHNRINMFP